MSEAELDTNARTDVSYYLELKKELTALRSWKAKARPFLEERLSILKSEIRCVNAMMIGSLKSDAIEQMEKRLEELTELLKEGDNV